MEEEGEHPEEAQEVEEESDEYTQLGGLCCALEGCIKTKCNQHQSPHKFAKKSYFSVLQGCDDADEDEYIQDLAKFEVAENDDKYRNLVKLKVMADSGAADCVIPRNMFKEIPMRADGPKVGTKYTAANGKPIFNEGVRTLIGKTQEGHNKRIDFEVADVNKPLAGLRRIVSKGHRVVLDDAEGQGGYIENKSTKQRTGIYVENGVYKFDLYVDVGASVGFGRQGA